MHAYLFPGQGTQFPGMGKGLFDSPDLAKHYFKKANEILGFSLKEVMFEASVEELKQTKYAQPAIFLYSVIKAKSLGNTFQPAMVAGHSLGEISALTAVDAIDFESALSLIAIRANAMQEACDEEKTGMAVVVGLYDIIVENICKQVEGIVLPANYNALHQVVISGEMTALNEACEKLRPGASRVVKLSVNGAFHSPYMEPVVDDFKKGLDRIDFKKPICPVYQNIAGRPVEDITLLKKNLVSQLTSPVMWRQTILHMIEDGASEFTEIGPGNFLKGLVHQIDSTVNVNGMAATTV
jgi:[acyl-carrier-protein] S-malonyltransferase